MRLVAAFSCAVMLMCLGVLPCQAEKRVALVIGNGAYVNGPLRNPPNDADDVAAALKGLDFETIVGLDLDRRQMKEATMRFARAVRDADVAVVYYSGHGMQDLGRNYLIPIDAKPTTNESDLRRMTSLEDIVVELQRAKKVRILVLDACRDNPFARSGGSIRAASLQRGLGRIDRPPGMIVAFATQAADIASDGTDRNSPFTAAFLHNVATPNIDAADVFSRAGRGRSAVRRAAAARDFDVAGRRVLFGG
jgi:uncharacterized caspase-like protein